MIHRVERFDFVNKKNNEFEDRFVAYNLSVKKHRMFELSFSQFELDSVDRYLS